MSGLAWPAFAGAGALGAVLRYVLDRAIRDRTGGAFPWGILVVNATGSLALGILTGLALYHGFSGTPPVVLGAGFCGAYTTFSGFTFDTVRLVEDRAVARAVASALGTLAVGVGAAALGIAIAALG